MRIRCWCVTKQDNEDGLDGITVLDDELAAAVVDVMASGLCGDDGGGGIVLLSCL